MFSPGNLHYSPSKTLSHDLVDSALKGTFFIGISRTNFQMNTHVIPRMQFKIFDFYFPQCQRTHVLYKLPKLIIVYSSHIFCTPRRNRTFNPQFSLPLYVTIAKPFIYISVTPFSLHSPCTAPLVCCGLDCLFTILKFLQVFILYSFQGKYYFLVLYINKIFK